MLNQKLLITLTVVLSTISVSALPTVAERNTIKEWDEMITGRFGYDYELYEVETDDDWTLTLFRITGKIGSKEKKVRSDKPPVFFMHGLGMDASNWVTRQADYDEVPVAIKLVDQGYDVWMGNNRGTRYSNVNSSYNIMFPSADFNPGKVRDEKDHKLRMLWGEQNRIKYDFSFYEMGQFDVPAFLDKI